MTEDKEQEKTTVHKLSKLSFDELLRLYDKKALSKETMLDCFGIDYKLEFEKILLDTTSEDNNLRSYHEIHPVDIITRRIEHARRNIEAVSKMNILMTDSESESKLRALQKEVFTINLEILKETPKIDNIGKIKS
jgi:hypothetical protein